MVGDSLDVRGFALTGVAGTCPEDLDAARAHLARALDDSGSVGLLLLSERVARLLPDEVERLRRSEGPPAVLVLPERHR